SPPRGPPGRLPRRFPTATSHGRGVDQLDPGDVSFSSLHRLARRGFLNAILSESNRSSARAPGDQALFSFAGQCIFVSGPGGTREILQDSRTQVFREDGRAEYNRFREAGSETISG